MDLETVGNQIESRLVQIRERIGARTSTYDVKHTDIEIGGDKLQELAIAHPGEPIIIEGRFHMAYIKDHSYHQLQDYEDRVKLHPNRCFVSGNKVHFYCCTTLVTMKDKGRKDRYRCAIKMDNKRLIDLRNSSDVYARLAYCKHCIAILRKAGRVSYWQYWPHRNTLAEWGDAKEYMDCVKKLHDGDEIRKAIDHTREVFKTTIERV